MKSTFCVVLFFLVSLITGAFTDEPPATINIVLYPKAVAGSGTWKAKVIDKLLRTWSTPDITANDLTPVPLTVSSDDNILCYGTYALEFENTIDGLAVVPGTFLDLITVTCPCGKQIVFRNVPVSLQGERVQLAFSLYPI